MLDLNDILEKPVKWVVPEPMSIKVEVNGEVGAIDFECLVRQMLGSGSVYVKINGELRAFRKDRVKLVDAI